MKTEGVSDNSIFSYVLVWLLRGNTGTTFRITSRSIGEVTVEKIDDQKYTGQELTPKLNLTYKGKLLTENVDYVAVYSNNIEPENGVY